jgi:Zn-dependent protease
MDFFFKAVTFLVPLILSLTVHEYAHARVAYLLGDDTAARHGRMTLNPIPHIDLVGTILIPIIAAWAGGLPLIGWAKPVPVMPVRYTRKLSMHTGDMIVSVAGPLSNLLLATISMVALRIIFDPASFQNCLYNVQPGNMASIARYMLAWGSGSSTSSPSRRSTGAISCPAPWPRSWTGYGHSPTSSCWASSTSSTTGC